MSISTNRNVDWGFLLKTLQEGRSVLLLGPALVRTPTGKPFWKGFVESLQVEENPLISAYYKHDELFLFPDSIAKSKVYYQLKTHFHQEYSKTFYENLARLPFKMFINASPDRFLSETFGEGRHSFAYFHKNDPKEEVPAASLDKPLIYNLVGVLDEEESLLLTHNDIYSFVEAVISRQGLPRAINEELYNTRSVIFLGFHFDKWYVQLLLRLLKVDDKRHSFTRYATRQRFNSDTLALCEKEFRIEFIDDNVEEFFEELIIRCKENDLLRTLDPVPESIQLQIRRFVEKDEIETAIELLKTNIEADDVDLLNEIIGLSARFNRLKRRSRQKVISEEKVEVELARIRESLIEITLEIE